MSHRYGFVDLESAISDYLKAILNISNVCLIYDIANMYHLTSLCQVCKEFIDKNAQEILVNETFYTLSQVSFFLNIDKFWCFQSYFVHVRKISDKEKLKSTHKKVTCNWISISNNV